MPSSQPTSYPTSQPFGRPTGKPLNHVSVSPSVSPTVQVTSVLTQKPSLSPTAYTVPDSVETALKSIAGNDDSSAVDHRNISVTQTYNTVKQVTQDMMQSLLLAVSNGSASTSFQPFQINTPTIKATMSVYAVNGLSNASSSKPSSSKFNNTVPMVLLPTVEIPGSKSTVRVGLTSGTDTSGGGGVGFQVFASVVSYNASLWAASTSSLSSASSSSMKNGTSTSTSSITAKQVSVSAPKLVSDVVSVSVVLIANASSLTAILPVFSTSLSVVNSGNHPIGGVGKTVQSLRHNCSVAVVESVSMYCVDSGVSLNLTCNGLGSASVHQECPVSQQSCGIVNMLTGRVIESDYCQIVPSQSDPDSVVCNCGMSLDVNGTLARGLLSALGGTVSVAAFSNYLTGQLDSTVVSSKGLKSVVSSQSMVIVLMFVSFWAVVAVMMVLSYWGHKETDDHAHDEDGIDHYHHHQSDGQVKEVMNDDEEDSGGIASMTGDIEENATCVKPAQSQMVRSSTKDKQILLEVVSWTEASFRKRVFVSMKRHHTMLRILRRVWRTVSSRWLRPTIVAPSPSSAIGPQSEPEAMDMVDDQMSHEELICALLTWLTSFTVACFSFALFYDWQYPSDDSSCRVYTSRSGCMSPTSILDPATHKCRWIEGVQTENSPVGELSQWKNGRVIQQSSISASTASSMEGNASYCTLNTKQSLTAFLLSFMVGALTSALVSMLLDYCSDIILEYMRSSHQENSHGSADHRLLSGAHVRIAYIRDQICRSHGQSYVRLFDML